MKEDWRVRTGVLGLALQAKQRRKRLRRQSDDDRLLTSRLIVVTSKRKSLGKDTKLFNTNEKVLMGYGVDEYNGSRQCIRCR